MEKYIEINTFLNVFNQKSINTLENTNFFIDMSSCLEKLSQYVTNPCSRFISDLAKIEDEEEVKRLKEFFLGIVEEALREEELYYPFQKLFTSLGFFYSTYNAAVYLFDIIMNTQTGNANDLEEDVFLHFQYTLNILENYIDLLTYYFPTVLFILFNEEFRNLLEVTTNKLVKIFEGLPIMYYEFQIFFCTIPLNFTLVPLQAKKEVFGPLFSELKVIGEKYPLLNFLASPVIRDNKGVYHVARCSRRVKRVDNNQKFVGIDKRLLNILKRDLLIDHKRWLELELILKLIDKGVLFINNVFFTFKNGIQGEVDVLAVDLRKNENIIIYECKQGGAKFSERQRKFLEKLTNFLEENYVDVELKLYPGN